MSFLDELKRRRVVRAALVYLAVAFAVLQVADILAPALRLPEWTVTLVVVLLALGLPVALVLAWLFEVTPAGTQRTPDPSGSGQAPRWVSLRTVAAVAVLVGVGVAAGWLIRPGGSPRDTGEATLAVLPFTNAGAPDDEYFADGMSDAVRGKLAAIEGLTVIASASSNLYRNSERPVQEIGRELGVRWLLTGRVRWAKVDDGTSRVQVSPELVASGTGTTRWSEPFDAVLSDVFAVQGEIAKRVAEALSITLLAPERASLSERPTENLEAYDAFLRASAVLQQAEIGASTRRTAAAGFRRAVELDPTFAQAWAQLAYAHMGAYWYYEDRTDARLRLARGAADTALALAPDLPAAHLADGYYWYWGFRSYDRGRAAFERARAAEPRSARIAVSLGAVLRRQGRWAEAANYFRRAAALDPRNAEYHRELASTLVAAGELAEADSVSARAVTLAPDAIGGYLFRTEVLFAQERIADALATEREGIRVIGVDQSAIELANRSWSRWIAFSDSSTWAALDRVPLTSEVVDTGNHYLLRAEWLRHTGRAARSAAAADSAIPYLERRAEAGGDDWWFHGQLALAHALAGSPERAAEASRRSLESETRIPDAMDHSYARHHAAKVAVAMGDHDAAIAYLTEALAPPTRIARAFIRVDGRFAALRGDPRFEALVRPR